MEVVDLEGRQDKWEPTLPTEWRVTFLPSALSLPALAYLFLRICKDPFIEAHCVRAL